MFIRVSGHSKLHGHRGGYSMGQCKICGKEIAEGQDICESCQKDMDQVQVDVSDLDDLNLDDIESVSYTHLTLPTNREV